MAGSGSRRRSGSESQGFTPHRGHAQHLCRLVAERQMERVASLTRGAVFMCRVCGRGAARPENLCEPVEIQT